MKYMKRNWHYLLAEPFTWLFYYFTQPTRFKQIVEAKNLSDRIKPMLRLALPLFLITYPLTIVVNANVWATLSGIVVGIILGIVAGIEWGIIGSIGLGIGLGFEFTYLLQLGAQIGCGLGIVLGIVGGAMGQTARHILGGIKDGIIRFLKLSVWLIFLGVIGGFVGYYIGSGIEDLVGYIINNVVGNIIGGATKSIVIGIIVGVILGIIGGFLGGRKRSASESIGVRISKRIFWCIAGGIAGCIVGVVAGRVIWDILGGDIGIIKQGTQWGIKGNNILYTTLGIIIGVVVGIMLGLLEKMVSSYTIMRQHEQKGINKPLKKGWEEGLAWSIGWALLMGLVSASRFDLSISIWVSLYTGILFFIFFNIGYYRLPLYLINCISMLWTNLTSETDRKQVFANLHRSPLYWDESGNLPLPLLRKTLFIASEQNVNHTLEEIDFIVDKRPNQIRAAQMVLLEIVIKDLEKHKTMSGIAEASQQLDTFLQKRESLVDVQWRARFTHMNNASKEATQYLKSLGWQTRYDTLMNMLLELRSIEFEVALSSKSKTIDEKFNERLKEVVNRWVGFAQYELDKLEQEPQKTDKITNPYVVGSVLELGTSLFVGRQDLAQQLEQDLKRGSQRPTFFLNGERRMGKSSTLRQLPDFLPKSYLSIIYDLQNRGMSSGIDNFLAAISNEIYNMMSKKGLQVEKLEKESLQEASHKNEAAVYNVFDEWLKKVENILEQNNCTLLFAFDEFEKLEESGQAKYFDLRLLLDWFRNIIQHRPRLALLFSGGTNVREMGTKTDINWAGYFVNVQALRVSFLKKEEARRLITQPIPDYPIEQIFGEGVVEEIIRVTGCHPFLVQAICSKLVDNLNAEDREKAEIRDVAIAVNQVLENFGDTYFRDLWERTDQDQRTCLFSIRNLREGDSQKVSQQSGLDEKTVRRTLKTLLERDLVLQENGSYRIAAPIFSEWIDRNS